MSADFAGLLKAKDKATEVKVYRTQFAFSGTFYMVIT